MFYKVLFFLIGTTFFNVETLLFEGKSEPDPDSKNLFHSENDFYPVKGITVVAAPRPIGKDAFRRLKNIQTEWVAFVPYGFTRLNQPQVRYNMDRQWWGEKMDGLESCIKDAKSVGLKIMIKPQVFIPGSWVGDMDFKTESEWKMWEDQYRIFIMDYICLATRHNVEMFCIGTEFNIAMEKRTFFWRQLIRDIRKEYKGKLVYSANWDNYDKVKIWDELDYIGLSSYFPLTDVKTPEVKDLKNHWKPVVKRLRQFSDKNKKKILFTEYGYMSVDGCANKAWEIEKNKNALQVNQRAQANAYDAMWETFSKESCWAGGFLWKWFPDGMGHEGYPEKDYTPQDKEAEKIINKWFSQKQFNKI
ncbi:MAG: hypothetical protein IPM42_09860 [Saprospiraceae bacterium]|nr:hypothetical protein [Saprospiraceae bacterium]